MASKRALSVLKNLTLKAIPLFAVILLLAPASGEASLFPMAFADTPALDTASMQSLPLLEPMGIPGQSDPVTSSYTDDGAVVADTGPEGTVLDIYDIPSSDLITQYTAKPGDTFSSIAELFDISVKTIFWANNLEKGATVKPGQTYLILPITGVKHTVLKGDTLASIAKKYSGDMDDISSYNGIGVGESLTVGSVVIIPDGEIAIVQKVVDKKTGKTKSVSVSGLAARKGSPVAGGYYIRPIELNGGNIRKTQGFHDAFNGVDIGAPKGTPIHVMAEGTVLVTKSPSKYNGGYGGLTIVQHPNGTQTVYAHQSKILVSAGQHVSQGDVIGLVGSTGHSTGNHLHFEIRGAYPTPILY